MTLSENLKWDEHLWRNKQNMVRSIQVKTAMLKILKPFVPSSILFNVGQAMVNSTILYGAPVWGATSKTNKNKIQSAQIRAARTITGTWNTKEKKSHRQDVLNQVGWLNVDQIINSSTLNLLKQTISNKTTHGMSKLFKVTQPQHSSRTNSLRVDHKGHPEKYNSSFSTNAPILFNNLNQELKNPNQTTKQFKTALRKVSNQMYKLEEHYHTQSKGDKLQSSLT